MKNASGLLVPLQIGEEGVVLHFQPEDHTNSLHARSAHLKWRNTWRVRTVVFGFDH